MGTMGTATGGEDRGHAEDEETPVLVAARAYTRRGWRVVPVRPGEKGVAIVQWQRMRLDEDELPQWFGRIGAPGIQHNIGILTGEPSGGLVDVDCDASEARAAAAELLPKTGLVSGRAGNPASHYWYRIAGEGEPGELPATAKFGDVLGERVVDGDRPLPLTPSPQREGEPEAALTPDGHTGRPVPPLVGEGGQRPGEVLAHHGMLIELRSTGCQTIAPPSLHPSGETVRWERDGEPGVVSGERLRRAVAKVATVALLARHWPGVGERDEAAKDLAGLLLRGGWAADEVDDFTRLVATIAGDEEWRRRGKARGTARKLAEGAHVTGGTTLASRLGGDGERVVAQARTWLGLSGLGSAHVPASAIDGHPSAIDGHSQETTIYGADGHLWRRWSVTASALERTQVSWLWHGRIPLGAITMLDGDPGLGKSLITLDLAARVTTGRGMPLGAPAVEGAERGAGVVLLSAEDHLTATILPRLVMAAADMDRVKILRGAMADSPEAGRTLERQFLLPRDLPLLEEDIQEVEARLVVIDPLMAFLDGTVNSWRDQDVRAVLAPLAALAERTGAAILILRHLNKASGMSAIQRGGGSIGIIAAARSGLLVAKHPDNPDQERVLASTKSNLGPTMPALRYRLATPVKRTEGLEDLWDVPAVDWLGECDFNATALLAASPATEAGAAAKKEAAAMDWLREELADGARPASDLTREALAAGIAAQTFQRATTRLGVVKKKVGFGGSGHWVWRLPAAAETPLETPPETRETPLMAKTAIDGHSEKVTIYGNDDHLWKQWKATPRCPVTGGPHEYTQFRHADGRLRCVECGEARDEDGGDEGQEDEQGQGAWE